MTQKAHISKRSDLPGQKEKYSGHRSDNSLRMMISPSLNPYKKQNVVTIDFTATY